MYDVECKAVAATQTFYIVMVHLLFSLLIMCNGSRVRARASSQMVIKRAEDIIELLAYLFHDWCCNLM